MKSKVLRGSALAKGIALILACLLAAGTCAAAVGGVFLLAQRDYYRDSVWEEPDLYQDTALAREYYFLCQHRDQLTNAGRSRCDELARTLSDKNTNYRFVIDADAADKLTNDSAGTGAYEQLGYLTETDYVNGMGRMLAYYLDMDKAQDWQVRTGTPQEWAVTPNASRYYYTEEDYQRILLEAGRYSTAEEGFAGYSEVEDNMDFGAIWDESDGMEAGENAGEQEQYYYFVYTGGESVYWLTYGIDRTYPVEDEYALNARRSGEMEAYFQNHFPVVAWIGVGCLTVFLLLLTYLTWSIGWNRAGELALRGAGRMPGEIALALGGGLVLTGVLLEVYALDGMDIYTYVNLQNLMVLTAILALPAALGGMLVWSVGTAQLKTHTLARQSILLRLWRWGRRWLTLALHAAGRALLALPLYWKAAAMWGVYWLAFLIYYFLIGEIFQYHHLLLTVFWLTLGLLPALLLACKWAWDWNRLRRGVKEMVEGRLDFTVDMSHMLPDLKAHGEDLGSLSRGLSLAVEERLKGERFKTELITNVSHDLKTPLTSIISYVDLLKHSDIPDETARGYIDVLERKAQRLKTLTEDLVEASKAASGVIAVQLETLDVGQLVEQAAGEYDQRLTQAQLQVVMHLPETPCMVVADGRHLWRILDNLLSNCTKYAMPGTRVYLDVEPQGDRCQVTVKNISQRALNVPAEELMKRFVRGDDARSTEGSGLGLSIAANLAAVQHADFQLVIDGDLFKAVITLDRAKGQ